MKPGIFESWAEARRALGYGVVVSLVVWFFLFMFIVLGMSWSGVG